MKIICLLTIFLLSGCFFKEEIPFESKEITLLDHEEFNLENYLEIETSSLYCPPINYGTTNSQEIICSDQNEQYKDTPLIITVKDMTAPVLKLTTQRIQLPLNSSYQLEDYILSATDKVDGDLKEHVQIVDTIDVTKKGTYEVIYTLSDQSGHTTSASLVVDVTVFYDEYFDASTLTPVDVEDPTSITVLVNKTHTLPSNYVPNDLVHIYGTTSGEVYLREEAAKAYKEFVQAASKQGINVIGFSGYRSYSLQTRLYTNYLRNNGPKYTVSLSAYPGRSEHQLGLAIDISDTWSNPLSESLGQRALGKFIENEAYKYGFILRYQKDKTAITNYAYEPWHIRYVGVDLATHLFQNDLTLEEYYENK